jgi:hypothetical protein
MTPPATTVYQVVEETQTANLMVLHQTSNHSS